ncbi:hypothetical protein VPH35_046562 [Triticum aestivum]
MRKLPSRSTPHQPQPDRKHLTAAVRCIQKQNKKTFRKQERHTQESAVSKREESAAGNIKNWFGTWVSSQHSGKKKTYNKLKLPKGPSRGAAAPRLKAHGEREERGRGNRGEKIGSSRLAKAVFCSQPPPPSGFRRAGAARESERVAGLAASVPYFPPILPSPCPCFGSQGPNHPTAACWRGEDIRLSFAGVYQCRQEPL